MTKRRSQGARAIESRGDNEAATKRRSYVSFERQHCIVVVFPIIFLNIIGYSVSYASALIELDITSPVVPVLVEERLSIHSIRLAFGDFGSAPQREGQIAEQAKSLHALLMHQAACNPSFVRSPPV